MCLLGFDPACTIFTSFNFMSCWNVLIPYSRISRFFKTNLQDLSAPVFSNISEFSIVQDHETSQHNISPKHLCISIVLLDMCEYPGVSKVQNNWFGESWTCPKIWTQWKWWVFEFFPKWNRTVTSPTWSRIIIRSFRATLFLKLTVKMSPRPQIQCVPRFARMLYRIFFFGPPDFPRSQARFCWVGSE